MWLFKVLAKKVAKTAVRSAGAVGQLLRNPIKYVRKLGKNVVRNNIKPLTRARRNAEKVTNAGINKDLIQQITKKAALIEQIYSAAGEIIKGKSNATIRESELARQVNEYPKSIHGESRDELLKMSKNLDAELKSSGIGKMKARAIVNGDIDIREVFNSSSDLAYDTFMGNWKRAFFDSDVILVNDQPLDEEGKKELWNRIAKDRTFGWFQDKLSRE